MRPTAFMILLVLVLSISVWPQANHPPAARVAASSLPSTSNTLLKQMEGLSADAAQLDESHARTVQASEELSRLHSALSSKLSHLCNSAEKAPVSPADVAKELNDLCAVNQQSSMQYSQLQSALEQENRRYTTISNVMKTKHDTVKNSIANMR